MKFVLDKIMRFISKIDFFYYIKDKYCLEGKMVKKYL